MGSKLAEMKNEINKSGGSKGKIFYVKKDTKRRIRFLWDCEDAMALVFHDSYAENINVLCQEEIGKDCPYCGREDLRTRKFFAWPVWDYDAKDVKIFMYPASNFSPVPSVISMYETYGTLLDRDFMIDRKGDGTNTSYTVIPMDKSKFRQTKENKAPSEKEITKIVAKAYAPQDDMDDDDEYEEEMPKKKKASKKAPEPVEDDDETEDMLDYEDMSAQDLYKLCKARGIECKPKKSEEYYIDLLEEYDSQQDDDEEADDEGDEW